MVRFNPLTRHKGLLWRSQIHKGKDPSGSILIHPMLENLHATTHLSGFETTLFSQDDTHQVCASSDSPEVTIHPGRPWWALMDRHLKRESWKNMQTVISCIGLIATIWQQAKTTPAFPSLANIRINYSTTAVVSTVAGFQPSTLLHVPSCFFKFCDICVLDPATIWPFEFVGFFTFQKHLVFVRKENLSKVTCLHPCGRTTAKQDLAWSVRRNLKDDSVHIYIYIYIIHIFHTLQN